jgi:hypothetical protein
MLNDRLHSTTTGTGSQTPCPPVLRASQSVTTATLRENATVSQTSLLQCTPRTTETIPSCTDSLTSL